MVTSYTKVGLGLLPSSFGYLGFRLQAIEFTYTGPILKQQKKDPNDGGGENF